MSEENGYTPSQRAMVDLWEEHTAHEFGDHSTEKTLSTMAEDPVNINVPLPTGGVGLEEVHRYYSEHIYWDQASVMVQVGLLDGGALPVVGAESARKLLDPTSIPSDLLILRAEEG